MSPDAPWPRSPTRADLSPDDLCEPTVDLSVEEVAEVEVGHWSLATYHLESDLSPDPTETQLSLPGVFTALASGVFFAVTGHAFGVGGQWLAVVLGVFGLTVSRVCGWKRLAGMPLAWTWQDFGTYGLVAFGAYRLLGGR